MSFVYHNQLAGQFGHIYKTVGSSIHPSTGVKRKNLQKSPSSSSKGPKVIKVIEKPSKSKKSLKKKSSTKRVTFLSPVNKKRRAVTKKKKVSVKKQSKKRKRSILD